MKYLLSIFGLMSVLAFGQATTTAVEVPAEPGLWQVFVETLSGYANYIWSEITFQTNPWYVNYFWWLVILSLVVWFLEITFPWRKDQGIFRKDFWMDAFYMFFNFYIFAMVITAVYAILNTIFEKFGGSADSLAIMDISSWPMWTQLLIFFILNDFVQWFTHVLLHRVPAFWRFHKVHHSVQEMGFAAHLRYHWMENILYKPLKVLVVMLLGGFEPEQAFMVHFFAIAIGHLNHANLGLDYGPFKYILNNPKMHIWHHAKELPKEHPYGTNFGISLSIWDYIFKTNYIPHSGRDIELGFEDIEKYPNSFWKQLFIGFRKSD